MHRDVRLHTRREFLQLSAASLILRPVAQVTTLVGAGPRGVASEGDVADRAQLSNPFYIDERNLALLDQGDVFDQEREHV